MIFVHCMQEKFFMVPVKFEHLFEGQGTNNVISKSKSTALFSCVAVLNFGVFLAPVKQHYV